MVIRRSALIWGPAFLLVGLLNVIPDPAAQHQGAMQGGQRAFGAAPVAASASPRRPTSSPTPTTHPVEGLKATILSVKGLVYVRHSAGGPWQRCEVGMVLEREAEFRVGPRAAVRFTVRPEGTLTLDRLGVYTLLRAVKESKEPRPPPGLDLGPGGIRYDIQDIHWSQRLGPIATRAAGF